MKALCKEADTCLNASTCAHGQSHNSTPQCGCLNTCYDFRDGKGATSATIYCVLKSEIVLPPPRMPDAMKAKRITPCEQQLPAMPPPTMPPLFVVVAWNRQRKWWMIAGKSKHAFTGERLAKMLPRTHWLHGRVYELSDNET